VITRAILREQIAVHLEGRLTIEDLASWAEDVFRDEDFETNYEDLISETLSVIRDAVDPHRFRWEEPDFEEMLENLQGD
jgi:hypothetical protein